MNAKSRRRHQRGIHKTAQSISEDNLHRELCQHFLGRERERHPTYLPRSLSIRLIIARLCSFGRVSPGQRESIIMIRHGDVDRCSLGHKAYCITTGSTTAWLFFFLHDKCDLACACMHVKAQMATILSSLCVISFDFNGDTPTLLWSTSSLSVQRFY